MRLSQHFTCMKSLGKNKYLIKICGNLFPEESETVAGFNPDFMGWIFAPVSPRLITPEAALQQIQTIKKNHPDILHTGVFAGNTATEIIGIYRKIPELDFLQIHGGPELIENVREELRKFQSDSDINPGAENSSGTPEKKPIPGIMAVCPVHADGPALEDDDLKIYGSVDYFVFDTYSKSAPGGTGIRFPLHLISHITLPYFVAGGLNPDNVVSVINGSYAAGFDVSSGLEFSGKPGIKDPEKIERFTGIIRSSTRNI
jgi:phosphoribosylanthranilate isomerase